MFPCGDLGPCSITYNGTSIGSYFGSTVFNYDETSQDVHATDKGEGAVDSISTGFGKCEVVVPMTRSTLAQLAAVTPSGSVSGGESGWMVVKNNKVGRSMYDNAKALVLTRIVDGAADAGAAPARKITVFKAYPLANPEVQFDLNNQRVYNVTFKGFPDVSNNDRVWAIGG